MAAEGARLQGRVGSLQGRVRAQERVGGGGEAAGTPAEETDLSGGPLRPRGGGEATGKGPRAGDRPPRTPPGIVPDAHVRGRSSRRVRGERLVRGGHRRD